MLDTACPSQETLRRYLQGDFDTAEVDALEEHLDQCPACEETVSALEDTSDTLMRHLPLAAGNADAQREAPAWIQRLKAGPPVVDQRDSPSAEEAEPSTQGQPPAGEWAAGLASYELLEVLGKGGMGVVYRGRHRQLGRPVAVKVVRPKLVSAAAAHRRFDREIQILGGLNHPGIVMATDAGRVGPAAYLVMELVDGVDLARLVRAAGPLDVGEACVLGRQIAVALSAAHVAGAVHRDVKPSNVMIDRNGRVKLLDFGLAYLVELNGDHRETSLGRLIGTLDYMAPEQAEGEAVTVSADLYGLGATLFYLLTGGPPHASDHSRTLLAQLKALSSSEPPPLTELRPEVPSELSDLVGELLSREPAMRPASAAVIADRLAEWADPDAKATLAEMIPNVKHTDDADAANRSLAELVGLEPDDQPDDAGAVELPAASSGGRRSRWLWVLAGFAAAAVWGIVLLVETPEGTLRIESAVDNVQVELLDEADRTKMLRIEEGENATELQAGRYRIRLAAGHDNLSLTPDTIELRQGEEQVARITQLPLKATDETASAGDDSLLYKGEPQGVWEKRFRSETNPVAKIEAAKALIAMAANTDPTHELDTILKTGGALVAAGWGEDAANLLLRSGGRYGTLSTRSTRWSATAFPELNDAWDAHVNLAATQAAALPPERLAAQLVQTATGDSHATAVFATMLLRQWEVQNSIENDQQALRHVVTDLRLPDARELQIPVLLTRLTYAPPGERTLTEAARNDLIEAGRKLGEPSLPEQTRRWTADWYQAVESLSNPRFQSQLGSPVPDEVTACVVLQWLLHNPLQVPPVVFRDHSLRRLANSLRLYDKDRLQSARAQVRPFVDGWVEVVCDWLEDQPQNSEVDAAVLEVLGIVLRVRTPADDWPLDRLAELLAKRVRERCEDAESSPDDAYTQISVTTEELLAYIILAGGDLPECVKSAPVSEEPRKQLAELDVLSGTQRINGPALDRLGESFVDLLQLAPYQAIAKLVENRPSPVTGAEWNSIALRMEPDQLDPLLLLAIAAELAGQSAEQDAQLRQLLAISEKLHPLWRVLNSDFAVANIAQKWLRRLHERAGRDELLKRLAEMYMPELADTDVTDPGSGDNEQPGENAEGDSEHPAAQPQ